MEGRSTSRADSKDQRGGKLKMIAYTGAIPDPPTTLTFKLNNMGTTTRNLSVIAKEINSDWSNVYFGAIPYLNAMKTLNTMDDMFYQDSASSIVRYFLGNANTWRGDVARRVKKELKSMLT